MRQGSDRIRCLDRKSCHACNTDLAPLLFRFPQAAPSLFPKACLSVCLSVTFAHPHHKQRPMRTCTHVTATVRRQEVSHTLALRPRRPHEPSPVLKQTTSSGTAPGRNANRQQQGSRKCSQALPCPAPSNPCPFSLKIATAASACSKVPNHNNSRTMHTHSFPKNARQKAKKKPPSAAKPNLP